MSFEDFTDLFPELVSFPDDIIDDIYNSDIDNNDDGVIFDVKDFSEKKIIRLITIIL